MTQTDQKPGDQAARDPGRPAEGCAGRAPQGSATEVFATFLRLGLTSFGGPVAHLGYFRDEIVVRRGWLDDRAYGDLVALCQFLPGPASSQVGFALGLMRAGWIGAFAAFVAFTLPSALLLLGFAMSVAQIPGGAGTDALHGLKIVAVAVVAQAVLGMGRSLCPDRARALIAVGAVAVLALVPGPLGMIGAITLGALAGLMVRHKATGETAAPAFHRQPVSGRGGALAFGVFLGLLLGLPLLADLSQGWAMADAFYRSGALVFGGGHVVLPLLDAEVVQTGWVSANQFLAGYGLTQAMPGPLFTFAGYLGAVSGSAPNGIAGAALALAAVFLPGFLLLMAAIPVWDRLRGRPPAQALMRGANAAVVGILGAALYDPVFTSAITDLRDLALALACFIALVMWKVAPWIVVLGGAMGGIALGLIG